MGVVKVMYRLTFSKSAWRAALPIGCWLALLIKFRSAGEMEFGYPGVCGHRSEKNPVGSGDVVVWWVIEMSYFPDAKSGARRVPATGTI